MSMTAQEVIEKNNSSNNTNCTTIPAFRKMWMISISVCGIKEKSSRRIINSANLKV
jgi:hypothetical protein